MSKEDIFFNVIQKDRETFLFYVEECNRLYRSGHDRNVYREIVALHRNSKSPSELFSNDKLYALIHETLSAWNMDQRGARLAKASLIRDSARSLSEYLLEAYQYKMYDKHLKLDDNLSFLLKKIFFNLNIMNNKRLLVGVSKAMHFLLPDLVSQRSATREDRPDVLMFQCRQ